MNNRKFIIGTVLVAIGSACACAIVAGGEGAFGNLLGKAVWYVPYVALVGGIHNLIGARR